MESKFVIIKFMVSWPMNLEMLKTRAGSVVELLYWARVYNSGSMWFIWVERWNLNLVTISNDG